MVILIYVCFAREHRGIGVRFTFIIGHPARNISGPEGTRGGHFIQQHQPRHPRTWCEDLPAIVPPVEKDPRGEHEDDNYRGSSTWKRRLRRTAV